LLAGPLGQLAIPETQEASCELGRGTKWCTAAAKDNMFDQYSEDGPLYVWRDKNGKKYQFHFETAQFMDSKDVPIDARTIEYFRTKHPVLSKLFVKGEKDVLKDPGAAISYALGVIHGRWPEAEAAIIDNIDVVEPYDLMLYAAGALRRRWPEVEDVIKTDRESWGQYVTEFPDAASS